MVHQLSPKFIPPTAPRRAKREKSITHSNALESARQDQKTLTVSHQIPESAMKAIRTREHSPDDRRRMIAEAAYYKAEQRQFATGHELEDWLSAEHEIDVILFGETAAKDVRW